MSQCDCPAKLVRMLELDANDCARQVFSRRIFLHRTAVLIERIIIRIKLRNEIDAPEKQA